MLYLYTIADFATAPNAIHARFITAQPCSIAHQYLRNNDQNEPITQLTCNVSMRERVRVLTIQMNEGKNLNRIRFNYTMIIAFLSSRHCCM